jgi:predicted ATP-dependent endonuclease of OLD family
MLIRNITLENFRSYKDRTDINELSNVNVFIGPNGAGKSNIVEALKFLRKLIGGEQTKLFFEMAFDRNVDLDIQLSLSIALSDSERGRILDTLFKGNTRVALDSIKGTSFLRSLTYSVTIGQRGLKSETVQTPNMKTKELTLIRKRLAGEDMRKRESVDLDKKCNDLSELENIEPTLKDRGNESLDSRLLAYNNLSSSETILVNALREFILSWEWFEPNRQVMARMESGEESNLDPQGANLTKFMNSVLSSTPRRFVNLTDEVIKILPSVGEILAPLKERMATLTVKERGLITPTEISNVSYGFMQTLILTAGIVTKRDNSVIMIEEPELHLHAAAQRGLFELIQEMAKQKQFFLTTHSTIFTGCDDRTNTYLVTKPEGATRITRIETSKDLGTAKELLGHRNVDLYGDECVVFIEGDSEEVAFPIIAESLGYDLCRKGIRLVNVKGCGKATKIKEYLRYLKDSGVKSYVIADGNKEVRERLQDWQREGIIMPNNWTVWDLEFEDCFNLDMIVDAMNELMKEQKTELRLTVQQLTEARKEKTSIVKPLEKILYEAGLSLEKPALAEKLAIILCKDLKKENHKETLPEKEIKKIVKLVKEKYETAT